MKDKLPKGWKMEKLGNITNIRSSKRIFKDDYVSTGIPFFRSKEIVKLSNGNNVSDTYFISKSQYDLIKTKYGVPKKGDILLTSVGTIGNTWIVDDREFYYKDGNITQIEKNEKFLPQFLIHYVNSNNFSNYIDKVVQGTAYKALSIIKIKNIPIPLPPLPEQKRIVQKLDNLFANIDQALSLVATNLDTIKKLKTALLDKAFKGQLLGQVALGKDGLPQGWKKNILASVVDFIGGSQPPKSKFIYEKKEGYSRLIQIRDYKSNKHLVYIPTNSTKKFCKTDDIMIGRYGPPVFQILKGIEGAYNVALMKAIPNETLISKDYLFWFLKNPNIQNYIISISQRSAGQSGVNKKALENYSIAYPSINVQKQIVQQLDQAFAEIDQLEAQYQAKQTALEQLKKSLLDRAFRGEL